MITFLSNILFIFFKIFYQARCRSLDGRFLVWTPGGSDWWRSEEEGVGVSGEGDGWEGGLEGKGEKWAEGMTGEDVVGSEVATVSQLHSQPKKEEKGEEGSLNGEAFVEGGASETCRRLWPAGFGGSFAAFDFLV
jgi:hypothetical protein